MIQIDHEWYNSLINRIEFISKELDKRDNFEIKTNNEIVQEDIEKKTVFISDIGKEFEENYNELNNYFNIPFIIGSLFKIISKEPIDYFISEKFLNPLLKHIRNLDRDKKPKRKDMRQINKLFKQLRKLSNKERNDTENESEIVEDIIEETQFIEREIAYFIFSLYAYMDLYCTNLLKHVLDSPQFNGNLELKEALDHRYNPSEKMKVLLNELTFKKVKLSKICRDLLKEQDLEDIFRSFTEIINIRHPLAHVSPIINLEELGKKFPKQKKKGIKSRNTFRKVKKKMEKLDFLEGVYDKFLFPIEKLTFRILFIKEIGKAGVKYLSIADNIIISSFAYEKEH